MIITLPVTQDQVGALVNNPFDFLNSDNQSVAGAENNFLQILESNNNIQLPEINPENHPLDLNIIRADPIILAEVPEYVSENIVVKVARNSDETLFDDINATQDTHKSLNIDEVHTTDKDQPIIETEPLPIIAISAFAAPKIREILDAKADSVEYSIAKQTSQNINYFAVLNNSKIEIAYQDNDLLDLEKINHEEIERSEVFLPLKPLAKNDSGIELDQEFFDLTPIVNKDDVTENNIQKPLDVASRSKAESDDLKEIAQQEEFVPQNEKAEIKDLAQKREGKTIASVETTTEAQLKSEDNFKITDDKIAVENHSKTESVAHDVGITKSDDVKIIDQVILQVTKGVEKGINSIGVKLEPESLGKIEVKIDQIDDRMRVSFVVEKSDTLDLLQAEISSLEQALHNSGIKSEAGELSFRLADQQTNDNNNDKYASTKLNQIMVDDEQIESQIYNIYELNKVNISI